jgi:hypothetical protein
MKLSGEYYMSRIKISEIGAASNNLVVDTNSFLEELQATDSAKIFGGNKGKGYKEEGKGGKKYGDYCGDDDYGHGGYGGYCGGGYGHGGGYGGGYCH